jgi:S-adenosylmethionine:tRNA ribosyltransferase-isomerase
MTRLKNINIEEYNYNLPDNRIAKYPLQGRDSSKLLIYRDEQVSDSVFCDITEYLPKNSLLVFNDSKVINARFEFFKSTGARIEIFCLEPYNPSDYQLSLSAKSKTIWKCLVGNSKKWKNEDLILKIRIDNMEVLFKAIRKENLDDAVLVEFTWNNDAVSLADIFDITGNVPIPPYLNRKAEELDRIRYQTVYGEYKGSVAAPTAGLHFTDDLLNRIKQNSIKCKTVTLHVGAGTFQPVKTDNIADHNMHTEFFSVSKNLVENLLNFYNSISVVGTTSVRSLESIYCIGKQLLNKPNIEEKSFFVSQWEAYKYSKDRDALEVLENLYLWMTERNFDKINCHTQIMIIPGFCFRFTDRLITNFHQPKSTLLMLISAYTETNWKTIYTHALENDYRFLSYGDSMMLFKNKL